MRLAVKCSMVLNAILCIATTAESGVISCRPTCIRFQLERSAVDCRRSGAFVSEQSPWDLARFRAAPCNAGVRGSHTTSLPEDLSIWVYESGLRHDVMAVSTHVNIGRDDAFTYCSRYLCPSSECEIPAQFGSSLQIDIHSREGGNGALIMSLTLGLTTDFVRRPNENSGVTRFGPLVLLWLDDPLQCRHDFVEGNVALGSNDIIDVQLEDDDLPIHVSPQYPSTFDATSLSKFLAQDESSLTNAVARFTEEDAHPVALSPTPFQGLPSNAPSISPTSTFSPAGSDQPSGASVIGHSPSPIETRSAIPSHSRSSLWEAPTTAPSISPTSMHWIAGSDQPSVPSFKGRSPTPTETPSAAPSHSPLPRRPVILRSEGPSSDISVERSQNASTTPMKNSTNGILAPPCPISVNCSGLEQGDTSADTSSSPEHWNGLLVLVVGMLCLLATAAVLLSHMVRRRNLQGFEQRRESERASRVQEGRTRHPSLDHRRPDVAPVGSDEWLAGLGHENAGSLPSSPRTLLSKQGEFCGSDELYVIDIESNRSSTTTESWSVDSIKSMNLCEYDCSEPLEFASDSSASRFESERDCGIATRLELSQFSKGFDCDRKGAAQHEFDSSSTQCIQVGRTHNMMDRIELRQLSSSGLPEILAREVLGSVGL